MAEKLQITSSEVLAALAHPARRRLLDVLAVDGPSTVSAMADRTTLAVGSVSHHLKVLAKAGLVEEAPDLAKDRREHWWRAANTSVSWSTGDFNDEPAAGAIAAAAAVMNLEHHVAKVRTWQAQSSELRETWEEAAFATDTWLHLTPEELLELSSELSHLLRTWHDRPRDDDVPRTPVFVFAHGFPSEP